jgi:hypothetical protein
MREQSVFVNVTKVRSERFALPSLCLLLDLGGYLDRFVAPSKDGTGLTHD